jgi:hypothetical protein
MSNDSLQGILSKGAEHMHSCNCMGPRNGEPLCRCAMARVQIIDGRYVMPARDLGPVRENVGGYKLVLADATKKIPPQEG